MKKQGISPEKLDQIGFQDAECGQTDIKLGITTFGN